MPNTMPQPSFEKPPMTEAEEEAKTERVTLRSAEFTAQIEAENPEVKKEEEKPEEKAVAHTIISAWGTEPTPESHNVPPVSGERYRHVKVQILKSPDEKSQAGTTSKDKGQEAA